MKNFKRNIYRLSEETVLSFLYLGTANEYLTSEQACAEKNCAQSYFLPIPTIYNGQKVYNDPGLTSEYNGGNQWIAISENCNGVFTAVQVNTTGTIIDYIGCSNPTTTTTTSSSTTTTTTTASPGSCIEYIVSNTNDPLGPADTIIVEWTDCSEINQSIELAAGAGYTFCAIEGSYVVPPAGAINVVGPCSITTTTSTSTSTSSTTTTTTTTSAPGVGLIWSFSYTDFIDDTQCTLEYTFNGDTTTILSNATIPETQNITGNTDIPIGASVYVYIYGHTPLVGPGYLVFTDIVAQLNAGGTIIDQAHTNALVSSSATITFTMPNQAVTLNATTNAG